LVVAMGEVKHLCLVKFKEGVVIQDILKGMTELVAEMDMVKSFEWCVRSWWHDVALYLSFSCVAMLGSLDFTTSSV
jgi:hypothetical protein